jgi:hypothetical protein
MGWDDGFPNGTTTEFTSSRTTHDAHSERASVKQKGRMNSERRQSRANEFVVFFVASRPPEA